MSLSLSNALYACIPGPDAQVPPAQTATDSVEQVTSSPVAEEGQFLGPLSTPLTAIGLIVLIAWIIRRIARPGKLKLRPSPGRPNSLTPLHAVAPLLVLFGVSLLAGDNLQGNSWRYLLSLVASIAWLFTSLTVARIAFRSGLSRGMGLTLRRWLADLTRAIIAYLAVLPVVVGLVLLARFIIPPESQRTHDILLDLPHLQLPWLLVVIFSAVVVAPLAEEIYFRGILQSLIRRYTGRPWVAIVFASVLFGLIHMPFVQDIPALIILAVALGYNYERTGRLTASILIHAIFNAVNITDALLTM